MNTTTFLAQLWGPAIVAIGLGIFVSRNYYIRIYKELEKETLSMLLFAMVAITAGIAQIHFHNTWNTLPEVIISFLGWSLLLKGLAFAIVPGWVDQGADYQVKSNLVQVGGAVMLIVGIYLCWFGFLVN